MARTIRFIHTADLHLDAPFASVDASDDRVRRELVDSTYAAFSRVVDACLEHGVDFLVIAGDAYNSRDKSLTAQRAFQREVQRLDTAGIETYVAHGNHDPASGWSAGFPLPESVKVFPTGRVGRFEIVREGEMLCALYGQSFARAAETENLAREYSRDPGDPIAIGVLHTNAGGNAEYEPYAPCSLDDLRAAGMDYWALGHIHRPGRIIDSPRAVYAGSPQGLNPKESGPHGCYLVEIAGGLVAEEFIDTASIRWESVRVDTSEIESLEQARSALADACAQLSDGRAPVIVRVDLVGRSPIHGDLQRATTLADLVQDVRAEMLGADPWVWIDRVRDLTAPTFDIDTFRSMPDFSGDLVRLADELLADHAAVEALVQGVVAPLESGAGRVDLEMDAEALLARARDICLDRLLEGDDR